MNLWKTIATLVVFAIWLGVSSANIDAAQSLFDMRLEADRHTAAATTSR